MRLLLLLCSTILLTLSCVHSNHSKQQSTSIVAGEGMVYISDFCHVRAIEAQTGKELWAFEKPLRRKKCLKLKKKNEKDHAEVKDTKKPELEAKDTKKPQVEAQVPNMPIDKMTSEDKLKMAPGEKDPKDEPKKKVSPTP